MRLYVVSFNTGCWAVGFYFLLVLVEGKCGIETVKKKSA
jgi:hypothetical protein